MKAEDAAQMEKKKKSATAQTAASAVPTRTALVPKGKVTAAHF